MTLWLIIPLIVLATHRVTRLITRDAIPIMAVPREAFVQRWAGYSDAKTRDEKKLSLNGKKTNGFMKSLAYLWECDWCASMWVAITITLVGWHWTELHHEHWYTLVLISLTASSVTGLIAQREPE